jgi:hypothetical protein
MSEVTRETRETRETETPPEPPPVETTETERTVETTETETTEEVKEGTMSDPTPVDPKGPGRGRGPNTARGVQAALRNDVDELKTLVAEYAARLDALEAAGITEPPMVDPVEPLPEPDPTA